MNGDVFLSDKSVDIVLREECSPVLLFDITRREMADYKILCNGDRLVKHGKSLSIEETSCEYVGYVFFNDDFIEEFRLCLLIG